MCSLQDTEALEAAINIARVNLGHAGTGLDGDVPRLLRPEEIQGSVSACHRPEISLLVSVPSARCHVEAWLPFSSVHNTKLV